MHTARPLRAAAVEEGLTPAQSGVLATLVRQGPLRAGDLAAAESVNPTMLSRILGHLEGRGLIGARARPRGRPQHRRPRHVRGQRLVGRLRVRRAAVLRRLAED